MPSLSFRSSQRGFSLIELLLVLGVLAILLVAAFVVYPQVRDRNQANQTIVALSSIRANVNNLYASRPGSYAGLDQQTAINARVFPSNLLSGSGEDTTATSAWGGGLEVSADNPSGQRHFRVRLNGMSSNLCTLIVPSVVQNYEEVALYLTGGSGLIFGPTAGTSEIVDGCNQAQTMDVVFVAK